MKPFRDKGRREMACRVPEAHARLQRCDGRGGVEWGSFERYYHNKEFADIDDALQPAKGQPSEGTLLSDSGASVATHRCANRAPQNGNVDGPAGRPVDVHFDLRADQTELLGNGRGKFIAHAIRDWLRQLSIEALYIAPGSPGRTAMRRAFTRSWWMSSSAASCSRV